MGNYFVLFCFFTHFLVFINFLKTFVNYIDTKGLFRYNLFLLKTKKWKHYSKIIFKYVNNVVGPIFNEKVTKKWSLWDPWTVHECTVHGRVIKSCSLKKKKKTAQIGKCRRAMWIQTPPKCARYSHHLILKYSDQNSIFTCTTQNFKASFRRRECKWMKRIILEYYFLPLFESINGGNRKSIPLFRSLSRKEWNR